jgi:S-adenosylmethionine:tRNA ribosyltransferase-isomerase
MEFEELSNYNYDLPPRLIAEVAAVPRDSSKLFVYNTQTNEIIHSQFDQLFSFLDLDTTVVLNKTKVMPAKLILNRITGGKVEVLILLNESTKDGVVTLIKQEARDGEIFYLNKEIVLRVLKKVGPKYIVTWLNPTSILDFMKKYGTTPLPPYIKTNTQSEQTKRESYQSVFATESAKYYSVAAPTASLHFTDLLLQTLKSNFAVAEVELAIGMGTFGLLKPHHFETKSLHTEWVSMQETELNKLESSTKILAVGTTTIRTLESLSKLKKGLEGEKSGWTDLFITPPYNFKYATSLLTNFHVPESSLMLMVEAFLQYKGAKKSLVELYKIAIEQEYRFYSLGDAMLIL